MSKCIIFSRVSTDRQVLEAQTEEIAKRASSLGYRASNQIRIEYKESAIKKAAAEREGIIKLKEVIESDKTIDCVIIWELSRIGRRADVIFEVRDFLIKHHIRWIVMKPEMEILAAGGVMTPTTNLMLGVFTTFAENEMTIKKERFKRGKADAKAKGIYFGGPVVLGYVVRNKHYYIDPVMGPVIKHIFDDIVKNDKTAYAIAKECYENGTFGSDITLMQSISRVKHILCKPQYKGTRAYPTLVPEEEWEEAQRIMSSRYKGTDHACLHVYYCQGIIYDGRTDHMLTPQWADAIYSNKYRDENGVTSSISINIIDSLAFTLAHRHMVRYGSASKNEAIKEMKRKMVEINKKKNVANRRRTELEEKIQKIELRLINGKLSEQLANKLEEQVESEIKEHTRLFHKYEDQLQDCIDTINKYKDDISKVTFNEIMDDTAKKNIVQTAVKRIDVHRKTRHISQVIFTFDDFSRSSYTINSQTKDVVNANGDLVDYNLDIRISRTRKIRRPNHTENA